MKTLEEITGKTKKELKNLKSLEIWDNDLESIPHEIGQLTNLRSLSIMDNNNLISIPKEIKNLNNLVYLEIGNNHSLKSIPNEVTQLINLEWLDIENNNLESIPNTNNLTNLENFYY